MGIGSNQTRYTNKTFYNVKETSILFLYLLPEICSAYLVDLGPASEENTANKEMFVYFCFRRDDRPIYFVVVPLYLCSLHRGHYASEGFISFKKSGLSFRQYSFDSDASGLKNPFIFVKGHFFLRFFKN